MIRTGPFQLFYMLHSTEKENKHRLPPAEPTGRTSIHVVIIGAVPTASTKMNVSFNPPFLWNRKIISMCQTSRERMPLSSQARFVGLTSDWMTGAPESSETHSNEDGLLKFISVGS